MSGAELHWYVAHTRSCLERKVVERLRSQGLEVYLPVQKVRRQWSDRIKIIERRVLPGLVFIHCKEKARLSVFGMSYGIDYFLSDRTSGERKVLIVPDVQMNDFMRVVRVFNGEDDFSVVTTDIGKGDMVRVIRGPLAGMECECAEIQSRHRLVIRLGMLGSVLVSVDISDVEKI